MSWNNAIFAALLLVFKLLFSPAVSAQDDAEEPKAPAEATIGTADDKPLFEETSLRNGIFIAIAAKDSRFGKFEGYQQVGIAVTPRMVMVNKAFAEKAGYKLKFKSTNKPGPEIEGNHYELQKGTPGRQALDEAGLEFFELSEIKLKPVTFNIADRDAQRVRLFRPDGNLGNFEISSVPAGAKNNELTLPGAQKGMLGSPVLNDCGEMLGVISPLDPSTEVMKGEAAPTARDVITAAEIVSILKEISVTNTKTDAGYCKPENIRQIEDQYKTEIEQQKRSLEAEKRAREQQLYKEQLAAEQQTNKLEQEKAALQKEKDRLAEEAAAKQKQLEQEKEKLEADRKAEAERATKAEIKAKKAAVQNSINQQAVESANEKLDEAEQEVATKETRLKRNLYLLIGAGMLALIAIGSAIFFTIQWRKTKQQRELEALRAKQREEHLKRKLPPTAFKDCLLESQDGEPPLKLSGAKLPQAAGGVTIGRNPSQADEVLDRGDISRRHARFYSQNDAVFIEDLESTNGTFVDGARLQPKEKRRLTPGQSVGFGDHNFIFKILG